MKYDEVDLSVVTEVVKGYLANQPTVKIGDFNGVFDPVAAGLHALGKAGVGNSHLITVALGIQGEPTIGHPTFSVPVQQLSYNAAENGGAVTAAMQFGGWDAGAPPAMVSPWGFLYHASGEETAINSAIGFDDLLGPSALGGVFTYHLLAANGTVTLKMQDSDTNVDGDFDDLDDATSGEIAAAPASGRVELAADATVRQFLRWQLVFGTADEATFVLAFARA
jgi:hypothetical protein